MAYLGVAIFGAMLGLNVVLTLGGAAAWITPFTTYNYWIMLSSAIGGCAGLYIGRDWMGHAGSRGAIRAAIGAVWISLVGAVIGGTLALPLYGTMFGPFTLVVTLFGAPLLALVWACALFSAHLMFKVQRAEYDSILYVDLPRNDSSYF